MCSEPFAPSDRELMQLLQDRPVVALVGASSRIDRPSNVVMRYLLEQGYTVIPVNPNESSVLGERCYPDLYAVPRRVELVDVFRRSELTPEVARAAREVGARILWLQVGVLSEEAAAIARQAGLVVVMDRCLKVEHERLIGMPFRPAGTAAESRARVVEAPVADAVGLCRDCRHARQVPATRIIYWLCRRSADDPSFPRYPRLPIRACRGFAWGEDANEER